MERKQRTIRTSQSCQGVGLHTGVKTEITFHPAPENYGIRFIRSDIKDCTEIKADIDHVVDISRGTTIEENDVRIHTVEHALAAVSGLRLDNILIELTGKEPPVMTTRQELKTEAAREEWKKLIAQGWRRTEEVWTKKEG